MTAGFCGRVFIDGDAVAEGDVARECVSILLHVLSFLRRRKNPGLIWLDDARAKRAIAERQRRGDINEEEAAAAALWFRARMRRIA